MKCTLLIIAIVYKCTAWSGLLDERQNVFKSQNKSSCPNLTLVPKDDLHELEPLQPFISEPVIAYFYLNKEVESVLLRISTTEVTLAGYFPLPTFLFVFFNNRQMIWRLSIIFKCCNSPPRPLGGSKHIAMHPSNTLRANFRQFPCLSLTSAVSHSDTWLNGHRSAQNTREHRPTGHYNTHWLLSLLVRDLGGFTQRKILQQDNVYYESNVASHWVSIILRAFSELKRWKE